MPLTGNQIVAQACQNANVPGFTAQGQTLLNVILQEMAQDYNFAQSRLTFQFNMPTAVDALGRSSLPFPADYLRAVLGECFYYISGVPYDMIPVDLAEFDKMITQAGFTGFPIFFATDVTVTPPLAYFWPPPNGAYVSLLRYQRLMPDITDFTQVPWFPNQNYLLTRLTGELCKITDDERHEGLLSYDEEQFPGGAGSVLRRYLRMKEDNDNRAKTVKLDRRRFGSSIDNLRVTKQVGW